MKVLKLYYGSGALGWLKEVDDNGIQNGFTKRFYENGQLQYVVNYNNGKENGEMKSYDERGNLRSKIYWKNGKKNGVSEYFHENGKLQVKIFFKNGSQLDGRVDSFDEEGNLVRSVYVKNDELNGPFQEYYSNGDLKKKGVYVNGKIVDEKKSDNKVNKNKVLINHDVFTNVEFKQKLEDFKRENNDQYSFKITNFQFNKWSLTQDIYQIGEFKGYKFIKYCVEDVKFPLDEYEYEEILSYKEDDLLNFIGNKELNELCLWPNPELSLVKKITWEKNTPEKIKEVAEDEYSEFFEDPRYNPSEFEDIDKTINEFECGFILNNETFLKSINVELKGINCNSLIKWEFSRDKTPETSKTVQIKRQNTLISNKIKQSMIITALNSSRLTFENIPSFILIIFQSTLKEIEKVYGDGHEMIIFNTFTSMFFKYSLGTDSIGDVYDLIKTNKYNGISEVRFQIFKEFKPGFSISDFLNMFICVCIPCTLNDLTENQKNEVEKDKIRNIEKFQYLVESLQNKSI